LQGSRQTPAARRGLFWRLFVAGALQTSQVARAVADDIKPPWAVPSSLLICVDRIAEDVDRGGQ
jgi:hypothetical protein